MVNTASGFRGCWEFWYICIWWSVWSLGDVYLLRFSPWSEIVMLGFCAVSFYACKLGVEWRNAVDRMLHTQRRTLPITVSLASIGTVTGRNEMGYNNEEGGFHV